MLLFSGANDLKLLNALKVFTQESTKRGCALIVAQPQLNITQLHQKYHLIIDGAEGWD